MKNAIVFLILILATFSIWARLGETEAEIEKRYGKPKGILTNSAANPLPEGIMKKVGFKFKDYTVDVTFINGQSVSEEINASSDKGFPLIHDCFELIKTISGSTNWVSQNHLSKRSKIDFSLSTSWLCSDKPFEATEHHFAFYPGGILRASFSSIVEVQTLVVKRRWDEFNEKKTAEEAKKKAKDF